MTIEELKQQSAKFRDERDWKKFHNPKDLAISIALEASELLELFQWKPKEEWDNVPKARVEEELADVLIYCLLMSDILNIDLAEAVRAKIKKNGEKYPADKVKGRSDKYTHYQEKGK